MDTVRLLPMDLPTVSGIHGTGNANKVRIPFVRRLALGFVLLAALGLLYVPAYHSAQGPVASLGEPPTTIGHLGKKHSIASLAQLPGWSYNTSRDLYVYIHPENTTTILKPSGLCASPSSPRLVVIICSAVGNFKARMAIRDTWANKRHLDTVYNSTIKVAFLLGESDNDTLNDNVGNESLRYNDIIQERFLDTYNNLTLKSVMMLKWATSNCRSAKFLMKTDDDMFVNVPKLLQALESQASPNGVLMGSLICNAHPIADPKNKWYTPKYMYSERTYPNYLSGTGYVMSLDVAAKLFEVALTVPLLHLEDVYITGVCARKAKLRPTNHPGFSYVRRKLDPCILRNAITTHRISADNMYRIWGRINEATCKSNHTSSSSSSPSPSASASSASPLNKSASLSRSSRNAEKHEDENLGRRNLGYYVVKRKGINRCV